MLNGIESSPQFTQVKTKWSYWPCWGQSFNTLTKIQPLQDKALQVINFKANNHDSRPIHKWSNTQIFR